VGSLLEYLSQIPDPRGAQGRRHSLKAMLAAVVCAVLSGARGYRAILGWLHSQDVSIWHLLGFTRTPPQRTAFQDLLKAICPQQFEAAVQQWALAMLGQPVPKGELQAVAIDAKTLCGSLQPHQAAIQLLAAMDHTSGLVLGQQAVDPQSNEIKAAPELLKTLPLEGRVITGDAIFCQREICEQITQAGGDYFFVVKDNQPTLKEAIQDDFREGFSPLRRAAAAIASL
jgi:hypothetical protein